MSERNTVVRSLHDLGLAAWFGGSLAGAVAVNGAAADVPEPKLRLTVANAGWARWAPVNAAAIGAHLIGGAALLRANRSRIAGQSGVAAQTVAKLALTGAALAVTAYSGALGKKLSAADGVVYAAVVNAPATLAPDQTAYFGADLGTEDGEVVAIDAADGTVLWSTPVPGDPLGGTAVAGDLVITTLLDGTVIALRRDDGEVVWTADAGGGVNGWMAVLDDRLIVPVGTGGTASLVAFGLPDGT